MKKLEIPQNTKGIAAFGLLISLISFHWITPFMFMASLNFFTLLTGFTLRKVNRKAHAWLMSLAILSDLSLVLILEFSRDAIATAVSMKLSPLNQAHIYCSTVATVLYIPIVILGIKLLQRKFTPAMRITHLRLGYAALIFRTLGYFLMFSMLTPKHL